MALLRHTHQLQPRPVLKRTSRFIDRDFQIRYVFVVMAAAGIGMLVSVGPAYYLLNQNYNIFAELAFENSPNLIDDLQRERHWINILLTCGSLATLVFFGILSFKMTNRMVGPLKVLRNHLKWLSRGHWNQKALKIRDTDEFQDLIETYNYFYESFRSNVAKDLRSLKIMNVDPKNRDAFRAWMNMIEEKAIQLNRVEELIVKDETSSSSSEVRDSRHAS